MRGKVRRLQRAQSSRKDLTATSQALNALGIYPFVADAQAKRVGRFTEHSATPSTLVSSESS